VLRRFLSFCALLAVLAAPSVTSTRFFCRHTGEEISVCTDGAPRSAQIRADDCCDQRTFHAVEALERSARDPVPVPTNIAVAVGTLEPQATVAGSVATWRTAPRRRWGPPAFLAHLALLI
jgi:hypothetical protein